MEIYWKDKNENAIDIILEMQLKAFIEPNGKMAVVTTLKQNFQEIVSSFDKLTEYEESQMIVVKIFPLSLMPDVLLGEEENQRLKVQDEFAEEFCKEIRRIADGCSDLERSEMIRLLWACFYEEDVDWKAVIIEVLGSTLIEPHIRQLFLEAKNDLEKKIMELVLDYQTYMMIWERSYGPVDVHLSFANSLSREKIEMEKWEEQKTEADEIKKEVLKKSGLSKSTFDRRIKDAKEIFNFLLEEKGVDDWSEILENSFVKEKKKKVGKKYFENTRKRNDNSFTLLEVEIYNAIIKTILKDEEIKKNVCNAILRQDVNDNVEYDRVCVLLNKLIIAIEVVCLFLREMKKVNQDFVVAICNSMQMRSIPILKSLYNDENTKKDKNNKFGIIKIKECVNSADKNMRVLRQLIKEREELADTYREITKSNYFENEYGYKVVSSNLFSKAKDSKRYWTKRRQEIKRFTEKKHGMVGYEEVLAQVKCITNLIDSERKCIFLDMANIIAPLFTSEK